MKIFYQIAAYEKSKYLGICKGDYNSIAEAKQQIKNYKLFNPHLHFKICTCVSEVEE